MGHGGITLYMFMDVSIYDAYWNQHVLLEVQRKESIMLMIWTIFSDSI